MLDTGSPVLTAVAHQLAAGALYTSFLGPHTGQEPASSSHVRVTVLARPPQPPHHLAAVITVSPAGDLRGLTRREMQILGLLLEAWPNQRIATALRLAPTTVATHIRSSTNSTPPAAP
jgi:ATP/maltotriose-dependent transcriptional regulator MalT